MTINLINLPWGNAGITVFGLCLFFAFLLASFWFFCQTKEEFANDEKTVSFIFNNILAWLIGARLIFCLTNTTQTNSIIKFFLLWRYPGLSFAGGFLGIIVASKVWAKRYQFQIWKITDQALLPLLTFFIGFFLGQFLISQEAFYLVALIINLLTVAWSFWALRSYRSLIWYPSGKIGFAFLGATAILFLGFSLLAFFLSGGLYLETILALALAVWALLYFFLRSESKTVQKLTNFLNKSKNN
jgi:hypothetical protein